MFKKSLAVLILSLAPVAAHAAPAVGDMVGTGPEEAKAALARAGCTVREFAAEDGKIEAKCTDASNALLEVYIDPKSGKITKVKSGD